jgi:RNA polymerase sigma-70 factor, ECF subfamily
VTDDEGRLRAVEQAYRDHADDVFRVAFAILHDHEAAVDAMHECFARAFERWHQYDDHRPLRPWLHRIVSHAALDELRRRRVRRLAAPLVAELGAGSSGGSRDGADPATDVVLRRVVEDGLARLKPEARAALVLRHYYGYDYAEIGAFLRTSSGNVGSILSRAHATLRGQFRDEASSTDTETDAAALRRVTR